MEQPLRASGTFTTSVKPTDVTVLEPYSFFAVAHKAFFPKQIQSSKFALPTHRPKPSPRTPPINLLHRPNHMRTTPSTQKQNQPRKILRTANAATGLPRRKTIHSSA